MINILKTIEQTSFIRVVYRPISRDYHVKIFRVPIDIVFIPGILDRTSNFTND